MCWCGHNAGQISKVSLVLCVFMSRIKFVFCLKGDLSAYHACERQKRVPFNPVVCASRKHMYQPKKGN